MHFENAWRVYPARNGRKRFKGEARDIFRRHVTDMDMRSGDFFAAVRAYAAFCATARTLPMYFVRWLPIWHDESAWTG